MLNTGTAGNSTPSNDGDGIRPLDAEVSALMGDDTSWFGGESPEHEDDTAGAPPAALSPEAPETAQGRSEGDDDAEHAGAPPAVAAEAASDTAVPAADTETADPLAGAAPLTYNVNGESRTFDGIQVLGEHGAIISRDVLPKLQQRLSERDNLYERSQDLYRRHQSLESEFSTLTQWRQRDPQTGQERVLTGAEALEAQRVELARMAATNAVLGAILDPQQFHRFVDTVDDGRGGLMIVPNEQAVAMLKTQIENATLRAERSAQAHFASIRGKVASASAAPSHGTPAAQPASPQSSVTFPPEQMAATVDSLIQQTGVSGLTDEDKSVLAEQLPQYVRAATPEERFQLGQDYVVDGRFARVIQHTASLRKTAAQTATASQDAANKNARTLAQAAMNRRGTPQPGKRPQQNRPTTPQSNPSKKAWDLMENLAAGKVGTASE